MAVAWVHHRDRGAVNLGSMLTWLARMLLLRRFGGRGLLLLGVLNFVRRFVAGRRRRPPGVYEPAREGRRETDLEPGVDGPVRSYQPSQGSSQTAQREPRY